MANFLEGHHTLSPEMWGKSFTDWFRKCSYGYIFSNPAMHRMGNVSNILCPRCKELFHFKCDIVFLLLPLNLAQNKSF